jgi:hypothetical protein
MPPAHDETLWIDRRIPLVLVLGSAGFCLVGACLEGNLAAAFWLSGLIFMALSLPVFWMRIAVLRGDHVQIGRHRYAYADILHVESESKVVQDLAARVSGLHRRRQDALLLTMRGGDEPLWVPVAMYHDGPAALAGKIMARVNTIQKHAPSP